MSQADALICFCLSFVGGILFASFFVFSFYSGIVLSIVGLILIGCFWIEKKVVVAGFCFLFFVLGGFDFNFHFNKVKSSPLIDLNGKEVSLIGIVSQEPERGFNKSQMIFDPGKGKVLITTDKYSSVGYKDKIKIVGKLEVPEKKDNFDYAGYLSKDGISATMFFPEIEIMEKGKYENVFERIVSKTYSFKERMGEEIRKYIPADLSPVMESLILNNDSKMDKETKDELSKSGLSHIIAISGSHIVVFSAMLFEVLLFLGFWRKQAEILAIVFTFLYVFLVGMPASAVRAGIMVSLLFLAQILGRQSFNLRTLVLAAFSILLFNPLLLKFDLGFQLSFLAVLGLILMGPVFNNWLNYLFKDRLDFMREILAMTFSAQVFTIPLLIYSFGYFSVVSLISNILVIPITPLLMALGLVLPLIGMVLPFLAWIVAIPSIILLSYMMFIVDFSSKVPFAVLNLKLPLFVLILLYLPFLYFSFKSKKKELEFLG
jgi:competence protein ComEC